MILAADPISTATLDPLPVRVDRDEVVRYLGYPVGAAPDRRVLARIDAILEEATALLRPRGAWAMYEPSRRDRRSLTFAPDAVLHGSVAEFLGPAHRFAVFVVTAGPAIAARIAAAWAAADALDVLILDAIGSGAAEGAADALADDLRGRLGSGEALTLRYSPGYCGMDINQQQVLFRLIDPRPVGVKLLPTMIMDPVKSVSGVYGVGRAENVDVHASPCERCELKDCRMRR